MMEHYRKLIDKLTCEIGMHRQEDGFQSAPLREKILSELRQLPVLEAPAEIAAAAAHPQMDADSRNRLDFLIQARRIGGAIARAQIQEELPLPASHYLYDMVLAGADALGREIARGYAVELYPELVRLREQKIELPSAVPGREPEPPAKPRFGFTVETAPFFVQLNDIEPFPPETGWEITHDELRENYRERFTFDTEEEAERDYRLWEKFRDGDSPTPPVRYAICVQAAGDIGEIFHLTDEVEKSAETGLLRFATLGEAVEQRRKLEEERLYPPELPQEIVPGFDMPEDDMIELGSALDTRSVLEKETKAPVIGK